MKKILFPTDFSETSRNAFIYALRLADNIGAEVVTLHVYDLPTLSLRGIPSSIKEIYDSIELENFENYKDEIPYLRIIAEENDLGHIKLSNILKHGDFIWTLNHVAKEEEADLIVMGTTGAKGLKEIFVGSISGSVLVESDTNVLIVPEEAKHENIKNIAFTTRFREKDYKGLKQIIEIAKGFDAHVHCLYVKTPSSDVSEEEIAKWEKKFKKEKVEFHIVEASNVKETIRIFNKLMKIDLMAIVSYKRSFFQELLEQSLAQKLSYQARVPILTFKE